MFGCLSRPGPDAEIGCRPAALTTSSCGRREAAWRGCGASANHGGYGEWLVRYCLEDVGRGFCVADRRRRTRIDNARRPRVIDGNIGEQMYKWAHDLFPICRSITGEGVRATLRYLKNWYRRYKSLRCRRETKVLDRTVPDEWNIRDAFIADEN